MVLPRNRKNVLCFVLSGNFPSQQLSNKNASASLLSVIINEMTFLFKSLQSTTFTYNTNQTVKYL